MGSSSRIIGYARVSTDEQNLDLQINALRTAGCDEIFTDHVSGGIPVRTGLTQATDRLREGDKLVVWRLDRLGRSLLHLVQFLDVLGVKKIKFCSLCEHIDTGSSGGRLVFHMMAALAEFERSLISERTRAGMAAARSKGTHLGRRPAMNEEQRREAISLLKQGSRVEDVANGFSVTPRTLLRSISDARLQLPLDCEIPGQFRFTPLASQREVKI